MKSPGFRHRWLATAIAAASLGGAGFAMAQETVLPDLGSSAGELITPAQEAEYGAYTLYQMRQ